MGLDIARGKVMMTPVVIQTLDISEDADAVPQIHHDINVNLGGKLEYTKADENDKWWYTEVRDASTTEGLLIPISTVFTDGTGPVASGDKIRFLFVKHTGKDGTGAANIGALYLSLDGAEPSGTLGDGLLIGSDEAIILRFTALTMSNLKVKAQAGTVRCIVAAIISDVSAGGGGGG